MKVRKICAVCDCTKVSSKRGWCDMHYSRWKIHGDPLKVLIKGDRLGKESKATKKAVVHPTQRDLGWAAGFLEGEGTFDKGGRSARVSAVQVNHEPIDKLLKLFGGAIRQSQKKRYPIHKSQPSPTQDWYVSGSRARGIMLTLYPLLSEKRKEKIRAALA